MDDCKSQNTKNEQQKDLCITSEQLAEQWVNIYKSKKHGSYWTGAFCYKTKEEAVKDLADKENYLTTINIEEVLEFKEENAQLKEQIERLEKQLKIAVEALDKVAIYMTCDEVEIREIQPGFCADQSALDAVNEAMDKIKELEK